MKPQKKRNGHAKKQKSEGGHHKNSLGKKSQKLEADIRSCALSEKDRQEPNHL